MDIKEEREYDSNGNLIRKKDSNGTESWYNEKGEIFRSILFNGNEYWYDSKGNIIDGKDAKGKQIVCDADERLPIVLHSGIIMLVCIIAVYATHNLWAMFIGVPFLIVRRIKLKDSPQKDTGGGFISSIYGFFLVLEIASVCIGTPNTAKIISEVTYRMETGMGMGEPRITIHETARPDIYTAIGFYELQEENTVIPHKITNKAKGFLEKNPTLFPTEDREKILDNLNMGLMYEMLDENINNHGDRLMFLKNASVVQCWDEKVNEDLVVTEIILVDSDSNYYYLSCREKEEMVAGDKVDVVALPLAISSYENVDGGLTEAVVLANSHISMSK